MEHVNLEDRVEQAGQQAEWSREQDDRDNGAVLGLEAFQKRDEGDNVE